MKGFWAPPTRLLSITFSCGLAFQAYQQLVKGPSYRPPKLQDRVFFVTGANSGIGFEASKAFALAGATVVFGCRDQKRATTAMRALVTEGVSEAQLHFLPLDLTSLQSVRRCAQLLEESGLKVDVLVLNAGVMRRCRELTEDGFEMTMAANHLGHFLLVQLLVPHLLAQEAQGRHPRVVMVGSNLCYSHDVFDFEELVAVRSRREAESFKAKPYSLFSAYAQSKLANLLMTSELARRLPRCAGSLQCYS
ncbi:WW domain-containing oxidoreductase [Durusdinium trenchii]|uniref:WW domain-containing oxidoreductase n=1 Tax=Durusdinium trenchii TaxID=1381693 RepID=A0ABP0JQX8_9DINO